jgi:hypothetical protein
VSTPADADTAPAAVDARTTGLLSDRERVEDDLAADRAAPLVAADDLAAVPFVAADDLITRALCAGARVAMCAVTTAMHDAAAAINTLELYMSSLVLFPCMPEPRGKAGELKNHNK